jgi:hypothetical protein
MSFGPAPPDRLKIWRFGLRYQILADPGTGGAS